jgi:archaellum component FlaC
MKIIEKLSTYAALVGVIGAIGGGFYTWGQFNTRLDAIESTPAVDLSPLKDKDKELNAKVDSALLYANEYKVDLIDRIAQVEEKIQPVDLTSVFSQIGKVREEIAMLDIPEDTDLTEVYSEISGVKESIAGINIPNIDGLKKDIKEIKAALSEMERKLAVVAKENELQDILIEEMKTRANNPLAN